VWLKGNQKQLVPPSNKLKLVQTMSRIFFRQMFDRVACTKIVAAQMLVAGAAWDVLLAKTVPSRGKNLKELLIGHYVWSRTESWEETPRPLVIDHCLLLT
jgi:hypothetical protein